PRLCPAAGRNLSGRRRLRPGQHRPTPAPDQPDSLALDMRALLEAGEIVRRKRMIEAVADPDLTRPRLIHQPGSHVERIADEREVQPRESPQRQQIEMAASDPDMDACGVLHPVETTLPMLADDLTDID